MSDVTNYNSNVLELYSTFRDERHTDDEESKYITSARSNYSNHK